MKLKAKLYSDLQGQCFESYVNQKYNGINKNCIEINKK